MEKLNLINCTDRNEVIELVSYISCTSAIDKNGNCFYLNQIIIFDSEENKILFGDTVTNRIYEGNSTKGQGSKYNKELNFIKFNYDINLVRALKLDKEKIQLIKAPRGEYWNDSRYDLYIPVTFFTGVHIQHKTTNKVKYDIEQYSFISNEFCLDSYVRNVEGSETVDRHQNYWNAKLDAIKEEINNITELDQLEKYIERARLDRAYINDDKINKHLKGGIE